MSYAKTCHPILLIHIVEGEAEQWLQFRDLKTGAGLLKNVRKYQQKISLGIEANGNARTGRERA